MLASFSNVHFSYGGETILTGVSCTVEDGRRIGLLGPNGAGKSTLLNLLCGALQPDGGEVYRRAGLTIGYLRQDSGLDPSHTIDQEMHGVFAPLLQLEQEMRTTESRLAGATGGEYQQLAALYARQQAAFDAGDGYHIEVRINTVLGGMGFGTFDRGTVVATLSGGERTRLALCKLLLQNPALLVLDEATNHLDFKMLAWLEEYLRGYKGAIVTVSHDRYFLDQLVQEVWELENGSLVCYPAGYRAYLALREQRMALLQKEYERNLAQRAKLQDYVDKNLVRASTTRMAQSRRRQLEKMAPPQAPVPPPRAPFLHFEAPLQPVKDLLSVQGLEVAVEGHTLFSGFGLEVKRGEKVAIIGENGIGKSTLLKILAGRLPIPRGRVAWGQNSRLGYFDQADGDLTLSKTALDQLWDRFPAADQQQLRTLLGELGLSGEDVFKSCGALSGGERARLKFALLMLAQPNVLLLDEPTNHLDIWAKEALDKALCAYEGTVLVISHDRYLLQRVPTRILELTAHGVSEYRGNFEEYQRRQALLPPAHAAPKPAPQQSAAKSEYHRGKKQRSQLAAARRLAKELEERITRGEEQAALLEEEIARPEVAADYQKLTALLEELHQWQQQAPALYAQWEQALSQLPDGPQDAAQPQ